MAETNLKFSNILKRSITGILYIIIIVTSLLLNQYTFASLFLIINLYTLFEFYNLIKKGDSSPQKIFGVFMGSILFFYCFLNASGILNLRQLVILLPIIIAVFIAVGIGNVKEKRFWQPGAAPDHQKYIFYFPWNHIYLYPFFFIKLFGISCRK